jgi:hypothetical protein
MIFPPPSSTSKRPANGGAVYVQKRGHVLASLPVIDQFRGVVDLLPVAFRLAPEFHSPALRGLHSGACPFAEAVMLHLAVSRANRGCARDGTEISGGATDNTK